MKNIFIGYTIGLVGGNFIAQGILIPLWFGRNANFDLAIEHSAVQLLAIIVLGIVLKHYKHWR